MPRSSVDIRGSRDSSHTLKHPLFIKLDDSEIIRQVEEHRLALYELAEQFLASSPDTPQVFYIRGHSYEFDIRNDWDRFEELCKMLSGKDDIFYGTNSEILLH